ncbi:siderophore iron transporter mirB [Dendryphion nanum]|uniref:Siderophore iron transporter mirB n=1 Tax=Dendryphion nanum TaxID=256645 RepID=A0A9P9IY42_9PLEO|nr:siderophore iron transporter mirB [Dendryphion nanum]
MSPIFTTTTVCTHEDNITEHDGPSKLQDIEAVDSSQPAGVQQMQAITMVWNKKWLILAFALIWLISFTDSLQQQANYTWTPFVTSSFLKHGLTGITTIVANIVGGVSKLPLAKFIDLVGRPQGFLVCLSSVIMALILMAVCQNVQTYAAAQVFYWAGMNGITTVLNIFIADTSTMRNRAILFAFASTPYICNTFAGPELGQLFMKYSTWRWGYGAFAIITPIMCIPFWTIFFIMSRRADKKGVITKEKVKRTIREVIMFWCIEFDVVGIILICGGFSIFLLPFSLAGYQQDGWESPMIIAMIVWGLVLLTAFAAWERFLAPKSFFPFHLMKDRSVIGAALLGANTWLAFYSFKMYYSSYLQVVFQLSIAKAGYVTNIYNIVSCTWALIISLAFKHTDRFKWGAVIAVPIQILMTALMIRFRQPGTPIGLLVMVEVFCAIAGGTTVMVEQLSVMSAVPHENIAVGLALTGMITLVGGAIGQSISAAMWTQIVPHRIEKYLPADMKSQAHDIYGSLPYQLALPWGSSARQAVVQAYADVQLLMVITGTCALLPCLLWTMMLKNYKLSEHPSRKGVVW